jgi:hypothetical protein
MAYKKEYLSLPAQYHYDTEENEFWTEEKRARAEILDSIEKEIKSKNKKIQAQRKGKQGNDAIDFEFATPETVHSQKRSEYMEIDSSEDIQPNSHKRSREMASINSRKQQKKEGKRIRFGSSTLKTKKLPKARLDEDCD